MSKRKGEAMVAREMSLGETEREVVGCIVTAREQTTDERIVLHQPGTPQDALRAICETLDRKDGDWKVLSYATPQTIFRDMQGTRGAVRQDTIWFPEPRVLELIDRYDMLDPSLIARDENGRRNSIRRRKRRLGR